ncbi:MAG TPA: hypothetical protein VFX85_10995 [Solirubrobacterales bacterium]|nr:hypothetical protein [Solirubrobacterales bacterium]
MSPKRTPITHFPGILLFIKREYSIKITLVALLLAIALAGCGGDSGETSSARPGLTYSVEADTTVVPGRFSEEEVYARAAKMCTSRQRQIRKSFLEYKAERPQFSREELIKGGSYSRFLPGVQFIFDYIKIPGGPEGDEETSARMEEMIGVMQYAIETGQSNYPRSIERVEDLFREYNRLARAYGFDECTVDRAHYPEFWEAGEKGT